MEKFKLERLKIQTFPIINFVLKESEMNQTI